MARDHEPTQDELEDSIYCEVVWAVGHAHERWGEDGWRYLLALLVEVSRNHHPEWFPDQGFKKSMGRNLIREVMERDAYRCQHCGGWKNLSVDHIVAESRGGPTIPENLQTLCRSCNSRKGTR